jgi:hypothetical protein
MYTLIFIVLAHWNNSPRVDMSLHSDTLFWFRADQSLFFLLNAACLEYVHIPKKIMNYILFELYPFEHILSAIFLPN